MDTAQMAQVIVALGAATTTLTEIVKWALTKWLGRRGDVFGPLVVALVASLVVALWAVSRPVLPVRTDIWDLFTLWLAAATAAAGIYGVLRAIGDRFTAPPRQE